MSQLKNPSQPPWRKIFLELATRALRKLNFEFATWTIGQSFHIDLTNRLSLLNSSSGLSFVLETDVCSEITLQFIHSGFTSGGWIDKKERRYLINREVNVKGKEIDYRIDLFLNRYEIEMINGQEKICYSRHPVLIEAKRFEYFPPNLKTGHSSGSSNSEAIKKDIEKLKNVRALLTSKTASIKDHEELEFLGFYIYIMFWGVTKKKKKDLLVEISESLELREDDLNKNCQLSFFPIKWDSENQETIEWGWICLYEIDRPEDPKAELKCI